MWVKVLTTRGVSPVGNLSSGMKGSQIPDINKKPLSPPEVMTIRSVTGVLFGEQKDTEKRRQQGRLWCLRVVRNLGLEVRGGRGLSLPLLLKLVRPESVPNLYYIYLRTVLKSFTFVNNKM